MDRFHAATRELSSLSNEHPSICEALVYLFLRYCACCGTARMFLALSEHGLRTWCRLQDLPVFAAGALMALCIDSEAGCRALVAADGGLAAVVCNLGAITVQAFYAIHTVRWVRSIIASGITVYICTNMRQFHNPCTQATAMPAGSIAQMPSQNTVTLRDICL